MNRKALCGLVLMAAAAAALASCANSPTRPDDVLSECGTIRGLGCPAGETCELPAGQCNTADLGGMCVQTPEVCTAEFAPVCGCDGQTYGNDCERLRAGVQKDRDGACA